MVRHLRHHEKKLLKKVDFLQWDQRDDDKERKICHRFAIDKPDEYLAYRKLCAYIRRLADMLKVLPAEDDFRKKTLEHLCIKLCSMGVLKPSQKSLADLAEVAITKFCARRFASIVQSSRMSDSIEHAKTLIEDGRKYYILQQFLKMLL